MHNLRELSEEEMRELIATSPPEPPPRPPTPDLELETWPPVWKSLEESPQFKYGLLQCYLKVEEDLRRYDTSAIPYNENNMVILKFLQQVRESRGYDIDFCPPEFKNFPLMPLPFQLLSGDDDYRQHLHDLTSFVVEKMNARAQMCGERYNFVEIEKVVHAGGHRLTLITFSVKKISRKAGRVKVVQAMVFCFGKNQFKLRDLRFKPQWAATSSTYTAGDPPVDRF